MSVLIRDPIEMPKDTPKWHPPKTYFGSGELAQWPERYWQGAWVTPTGHVIRGYVDELLQDDIRRLRGGT